MLRVVLDPNVLVSALISPAGVPAQVIEAVLDGDIGHVASLQWLSEADGLAEHPSFRRWLTRDDAEALIERLWVIAEIGPDRSGVEAFTRDPSDDFLVALARDADCDLIVSGDADLLVFSGPPEVLTPRRVGEARRSGGMPHGCVLVIDEADMAETRVLAPILRLVEEAGGKAILVGDSAQLPVAGSQGPRAVDPATARARDRPRAVTDRAASGAPSGPGRMVRA